MHVHRPVRHRRQAHVAHREPRQDQHPVPEAACPREGNRCLFATDLGEVVTDKLVAHFPDIMDVKFTSHMEDELDDVEEAKIAQLAVIREFWGPFSADLKKAGEEMESTKHTPVESAGPCPDCGAPLVQRLSKRGPFLGCSKYPDCKYIRGARRQRRGRGPSPSAPSTSATSAAARCSCGTTAAANRSWAARSTPSARAPCPATRTATPSGPSRPARSARSAARRWSSRTAAAGRSWPARRTRSAATPSR